ncbi:MAG: ATP-binding protein, partial [Anaerolineae bacterium]|nr:ATP-binding protein [Anaerolineae bacterium]
LFDPTSIPLDQESSLANVNSLIQSAEPRQIIEIFGRRSNGTLFPMEVTIAEANLGERAFYTGIFRDVTERKQAELVMEVASRKTSQLVTAITNLSTGMTISDPNQPGNPVIFANTAFTTITGYSEAEALGRNCRFLQGPDTDPATVEVIRQAIRDQKPCQVVLLNYRKDGRPFWNELTVSPVFENGQIINFIGLQNDVTDRITAQEQLHAVVKEEQYQRKIAESLRNVSIAINSSLDQTTVIDTIFEQLAQVVACDRAGLFLHHDNALVLEAGLRVPAEFIGTRLSLSSQNPALHPFKYREAYILGDVLQAPDWERWSGDAEIRSWVGAPLLVQDQAIGVLTLDSFTPNAYGYEEARVLQIFAAQAAIAINNARLYSSAQQEIAERKRTQARLLLQEQRLRSLYDIATATNQDINAHLKKALKVGVELLGLELGLVSLINQADYTVIEIYSTGPTRLGSGRTLDIKQTYCELAYEANNIIDIPDTKSSDYGDRPGYEAIRVEAYIGTPVWVNDRKFGTVCFFGSRPRGAFDQADKDFVRLMAEWMGATIERKQTQEALAQARDQALAGSRLKSELLAKVSHELRTPLGAILGYTELLHEGSFGPISDNQHRVTTEIIDSTNYLTNLVNELLDQSQLQMDRTKLALMPFKVADLIEQVETTTRVLAESKGLILVIELHSAMPPSITSDQKRLLQAIVNLIGNAIKFTEHGEVRLTLRPVDQGQWCIQVSDTGPGIPAEAQSYIFEPFRQVDGSISPESTGTGLGLSITKQLVDLMGGQISLDSEIGRGSTFTILLPLETYPKQVQGHEL